MIDQTGLTRSQELPELTEGQKACLRLVDDHHTSKEIARILGISPFTVDQRLDAARRKLNAESRREAAKIFAAFDDAISEPLVYEPQQVENVAFADRSTRPAGTVMQILSNFASSISVPPVGGGRHNLATREILFQSLNIAFFSTLAIAVIMLVLTGIMRLFA